MTTSGIIGVDPDDVALADAAVLQGVGEALDVAVELRVGDVALLALLPAPVIGDPVAVAGLDVAVQAVVGDVELAVGEPLVEGAFDSSRTSVGVSAQSISSSAWRDQNPSRSRSASS